MRTTLIAMAALLMLAAPVAGAKSFKRGVSENEFQFKAQIAAVEPGVSWYYNWGNSAGAYVAKEPIEYVPMCWNASYDADKIRTYVAAHPETGYLLGFNEPNFTNQANMTPAAAAKAWPAVQALAGELGLKLVAPALNTSPNPPYQDPTKWMDEFVALVGADAFDFTAVHSYGGFEATKKIATDFHDRYGKPVWVTEFCYWPNEGDANCHVSPDDQIAFMMQTVEWLEKTEWIYRYGWFKAVGKSDDRPSPNFGLIKSSKGEAERELSEQGKVYVNMPTFDPAVYHAVDEAFGVQDYATQNNALLGGSEDASTGLPLQFSRFNGGATADYQFDVPADGTYYLTLRVSGHGEPSRYDPSLAVTAVNADGSEGTTLCAPGVFTLPDDDTTYETLSMPLQLKAGKQTLRLKDDNPTRPSGIHISSIALSSTDAIREVSADRVAAGADNTVYNLQGMRVERPGRGLYIVNGKKTIIK